MKVSDLSINFYQNNTNQLTFGKDKAVRNSKTQQPQQYQNQYQITNPKSYDSRINHKTGEVNIKSPKDVALMTFLGALFPPFMGLIFCCDIRKFKKEFGIASIISTLVFGGAALYQYKDNKKQGLI